MAAKTYIADKFLGRGGIGSIFRVFDSQDHKKVFAVKIVHLPKAQETKAFRSRMIKTYKALGLMCDNPQRPQGILCYYDPSHTTVEIPQEKLTVTENLLVMEYLSGYSLEQVHTCQVKENYPLPAKQMKILMTSLLETVAYLHDRGAVHRDINLSNIMFSQNRLVIIDTDFMCLLSSVDPHLKCKGHPGTIVFASEELLRAAHKKIPMEPKIYMTADIWALGVCFFMLAHVKYDYDTSATLPSPSLAMIINLMFLPYQHRPSAALLLKMVKQA
jgi:serine/threonine protein kinase